MIGQGGGLDGNAPHRLRLPVGGAVWAAMEFLGH